MTIGEILAAKGVPRDTTILRFSAQLDHEKLDKAREILETWLGQKAAESSLPLPGSDFERVSNERAAYMRLRTDDAYIFQLEHDDRDGVDRRWFTGAGILGDSFHMDLRVRSTSPGETEKTVPAFLTKLVGASIVEDAGGTLSLNPFHVNNERSSAAMMRLLATPDRRLPVIVVSEPYMVGDPQISRLGAGIAHIVKVGARQTFDIQTYYSEDFRVFAGAVRVFAPGLKGTDRITDHPRWLQNAFTGSEAERQKTLNQIRQVVFSSVTAANDVPIDFESVASDILGRRILFSIDTTLLKARPSFIVPRPEPVEATDGAIEPPAPAPRELETAPSEPVNAALQQELADALARIVQLEEDVAILSAYRDDLKLALAGARNDINEYEQVYALLETERDDLRRQLVDDTAVASPPSMPAAPSDATTAESAAIFSRIAQQETTTQQIVASLAGVPELLASLAGVPQQLSDLAGRMTKLEYGGRPIPPVPAAADVADVPLPKYDEEEKLPAYLEAHYPDRFVVTSRARSTWADGMFSDRKLLAEALDLLGREYFDMKAGDDAGALYEAFNGRRERLGLRWSGAISDTQYGVFKSTYTVDYNGKPLRIEKHLRSNANTANPLRALAIYVTWDDEAKKIVLCALPGHLDNRMTP